MRNVFFDGASVSAVFGRLAGTGDLSRARLQMAGNAVMAIGLVAAGPLALHDFAAGRPVALALVAAAAATVALAALFQRQGDLDKGLLSQQAGLGMVALALAAGPGLFNGGLLVAMAALVYAICMVRSVRPGDLVLPLAAMVGAVLAGAMTPGGSMVETGYAVLGAGAALTMAALSLASFIRARARAGGGTQESAMTRAIDELTGAVVCFDPAGRLTQASRSITRLIGARPFEVTGTGFFDRLHVLDRPHYAKALSEVARGGGRALIEFRVRLDGMPGAAPAYRWIEMALTVLGEGHGERPGPIVAILRDISARKGVEDELRTARAQAEEASEAKTRFLATIGHELRTPLNAIVGFSDMMAEGIGGELTPTHQEYAGHIRQSGHHLLEVVNMLLDMSKLDAGKFEIHAEPFAPQGLVDPCLKMVGTLARERDVEIAAHLPETLPQLVGDERACRQIIINLLSNAIKFSHDGGRVRLAIKRQGKMLALSVSDDGIGMPADTVSRIGEPFLQAQNGLSRRYEGTGLGLSIVKGLVALHDGRLSVASEPGMGTRVTVLLPIDGPASAPRAAPVEHLDERRRETDEKTWQDDERKSATS
ncbi:sensor histidine kinase [Pelagibacterium lacus]|uniref:histidine kinase n=1 Tax=Pelagibacterium lacus TaxID=2282655 RepID=A0A369W726_9HYPH|nr:PAS domain-containing sensor histidine kinase [Pelagibacterium lacus]RDE10496.1 PAS domain S-box protein [Pelagibacterium lacus]